MLPKYNINQGYQEVKLNIKLFGLKKLFSRNAIMNVDKVAFLELCTGLKHLTLMGNPTADIENYRDTVKFLLPDLLSLDGEEYNIRITDEGTLLEK